MVLYDGRYFRLGVTGMWHVLQSNGRGGYKGIIHVVDDFGTLVPVHKG